MLSNLLNYVHHVIHIFSISYIRSYHMATATYDPLHNKLTVHMPEEEWTTDMEAVWQFICAPDTRPSNLENALALGRLTQTQRDCITIRLANTHNIDVNATVAIIDNILSQLRK